MPSTPARTDLGEPTLAEMRAPGVRPEVIDEEWKDEVVNRILRELKRQLAQLENVKPATGLEQGGVRVANARTLASIQHTLERLLRLEEQNALKRETKVTAKNDDALRELERRIDRLATAQSPPPDSGKLQS